VIAVADSCQLFTAAGFENFVTGSESTQSFNENLVHGHGGCSFAITMYIILCRKCSMSVEKSGDHGGQTLNSVCCIVSLRCMLRETYNLLNFLPAELSK
jgi:hypothetical protein